MIYLYEIECIKGQIYVGITENIEERLKRHKAGTGAKFTKIYGVKNLKVISEFNNILKARLEESKHVLYLREKFPHITIRGSGWTSTKIKSKISTS